MTQRDIEIYATDKLLANAVFAHMQARQSEACHDLVHGITTKAQGVFLWVYLVVRSLLRGLTNDDDLETLQRRLEEYPPDLNGYFQRMSDRIESVYKVRSSVAVTFAFDVPREVERNAATHTLGHPMSASKASPYDTEKVSRTC